MPRALDRDSQRALVPGAGAKLAARLDLASLGDVAAQARRVLVVDLPDLVDTEPADLAPPAKATTATPARSTSAARATWATPATGTAPTARPVPSAGTLALRTTSEARPRRFAIWTALTESLTPLPGFVLAHVVLVLLVLFIEVNFYVNRPTEGVILSPQAKNLGSQALPHFTAEMLRSSA
jgi:hypothetical protein